MRYLFIICLVLVSFTSLGEIKDYDYQTFQDSTKSIQERLDAIYYVRLGPYQFHQKEIDIFVNEISNENTYPELACQVRMFKNRMLFMEKRYVEYIPEAINILNGTCDLSFRDSVLVYWSLANCIEHGGVYFRSN